VTVNFYGHFVVKADQSTVLSQAPEEGDGKGIETTEASTSHQEEGYTVSGQTVSHNGQPIVLHGVNWYGFDTNDHVPHGLWDRNWKDMIVQMKSLGFNAIRLPVCPSSIQGAPVLGVNYNLNPDLEGKNSRMVLDDMVWEFSRQEMYMLFDFHSPDCGTLTPLWYTSTHSESDWITTLTLIATRYRNSAYLLGIDLKNEPHDAATWGSGNAATDWNKAAERAGSAVLAANPNILIFVEGVQYQQSCKGGSASSWWGGNLSPVACAPIDPKAIPTNKLVYSPHVFGPDIFNQPYFSAQQFPKNLPHIWDADFGYVTKKNFTVIPGEWGGKLGNDAGLKKDIQVQHALVDYFVATSLCNSFYWSWNADSHDTGGILQSDWKTPWDNKVELLQRYYRECKA
jgi:endoglucanase